MAKMIKQLLDKLFTDDGKLVIGDPHAKLTDWLWWVVLVFCLGAFFIGLYFKFWG